jgi:hypothetical protein
MYAVQTELVRRIDPDSGAKYKLVITTMLGGKFDLTTEYPSADECLSAYAEALRALQGSPVGPATGAGSVGGA